MVIKHSSQRESFDPLYDCKDPRDGNYFFGCSDIYLINQKAAGKYFGRVSKDTLFDVTMKILANMDDRVFREIFVATRPGHQPHHVAAAVALG